MENKTQENPKITQPSSNRCTRKKVSNINVNIRKSNDTSKRRTRRI